MSVKIIIGAQWGDEGKGKLVDALSENVEIVVRYQGGANAGHTVYIDGKKYILHLIPGGILRKNVQCVIGNGVVFDPETFFDELEFLKQFNIFADGRLFISNRAHVIFPYHKLLDKLKEDALKDNKIGTTGRGIGPAYSDKINRNGIRVVDLFDRSVLHGKIGANVDLINTELQLRYNQSPLNPDDVLNEITRYINKIEPFVIDSTCFLHGAWKAGRNIMLEGAQGVLLDVDFGSYPFVTSSNPTIGGAITGTGLPPQSLEEIIGVIKAYTTRVGSGPFPSENTGEIGDLLRKSGGEYGATTGRPRRCGWFDLVAAKYAIRLNGFTALALTKLDVLDLFDTVRVCTHYRVNGETIDNFPASLQVLSACEPVFETHEGWLSPTDKCRKFEDLPKKAKDFITYLETALEVPIKYVSVGVDRKQLIIR